MSMKLDDKMVVGKYIGHTMAAICVKDWSYIQWLEFNTDISISREVVAFAMAYKVIGAVTRKHHGSKTTTKTVSKQRVFSAK